MRKIKYAFSGFIILFLSAFFTDKNSIVSATTISGALKKAKSPVGDMSEAYENLSAIVYLVIGLGGFWVVSMIVWGGMTLANSGGNPQKRTEGFIKLGLTLVGAFIIFKSYDIAGWIMSF